jgi:cryptochrome
MSTCVVWFRKSLRLHDNPALTAACLDKEVTSIIPLYVLDPAVLGQNYENFGPSRLSFLIESLRDLNSRLTSEYASKLIVLQGDPLTALEGIGQKLGRGFSSLFCEYGSEPYECEKFSSIDRALGRNSRGLRIKTFSAFQTILDLEEIISAPGYKNPKSTKDMLKLLSSRLGIEDEGFFQIEYPLPQPSQLKPLPSLKVFSPTGPPDPLRSYSPDELTELLPASLKAEVRSRNSYFPGGETEALARLQRKVSGKVDFVNNFRKPKTASTNESGNPMEPSTTGLSPYLSTGCLSVRMLWKECEKSYRLGNHSEPPESLHGQLLFREMFYLLSRSVKNWDRDSENEMCKPIDWDDFNAEKMIAWEKGQTGFPLVDAMMRQLDATGWMHHLGRHAVSCFLTRGQLWQNWMFGREVFDKKLVDSDWALNNGNWLWLSGVAPFSMPYFRLYNPCPDPKSSLSVETKSAQFIKFWVPELKSLPPKYVYEPHLAPASIQADSQCIIGKDYPNPIVDRKQSAKENLIKFKESLSRMR